MKKKFQVCPLCARAIGCSGMLVAAAFVSLAGGCDALNPAFVDAVAPDSAGSFATVDNPPGHVVVAFVNNAEVNEQLLAFLETEGNLSLTDAEKRALRPRLRFLVEVTSTGGGTTRLQYESGSQKLVDQAFAATSATDLNEGEFVNAVLLCDVARVEVLLESLEVFIPAELEEYELVQITGTGNTQDVEFVLRAQIPPAFRTLQVDQQDDNGATLLSNIGIRDVPGPVVDPLCGSVIAVTVNGELSVPFNVVDNPSYDRDDAASVALIGGRFEFNISIQ